jgi:hypothetical protein
MEMDELKRFNERELRKINAVVQKSMPKMGLSNFKMPVPRGIVPDPEQMARINRSMAEKAVAPLVTRDAILALVEETRAGAKRDRWILGAAVTSVILSALALITSL